MASLRSIWTTFPILEGQIRNARPAAILCCALLAAGCSSESSDWGLMYDAAKNAVIGSEISSISLQQAGAIPYASMGVRLDNGPQVLIVMVDDAPHARLWTAGKVIAVQTNDGRIVRTSGFASNLSGVSSGVTGVPVSTLDAMHTAPERTLFYDFADMNAYSVQVVCHTVSRGPESVTILGKEIPTNRIEESCRADALDWSFTNVFWVGVKSGIVWKSLQHIHPRLGEVSTEILRPPQS